MTELAAHSCIPWFVSLCEVFRVYVIHQMPSFSLNRHSTVLSFGRMLRYHSVRAARVEMAVENCKWKFCISLSQHEVYKGIYLPSLITRLHRTTLLCDERTNVIWCLSRHSLGIPFRIPFHVEGDVCLDDPVKALE